MRVVITHLKAPWPAGARVGDVVDFVDRSAVPAWAVGKCVEASAGADAPHVVESPAALITGDTANAAAVEAPAAGVDDSIDAQAQREKAEAEQRAALVAEAKALGVKADGRWSLERLADEIAKAKAAAGNG